MGYGCSKAQFHPFMYSSEREKTILRLHHELLSAMSKHSLTLRANGARQTLVYKWQTQRGPRQLSVLVAVMPHTEKLPMDSTL